MAFQLSPGVNVTEIDLTTVVPSVASSDGAIGGVFRWGPVGERVLVDTETALVARFGKPTNFNAETFYTAANFLSYANRLYVSRAANTSGASIANVVISFNGNNSVSTSEATLANGASPITLGITAGMYVYANTGSVIGTGAVNKIASVNSSVIVFSSPISSNGTSGISNATVYFAKSEAAYSAVATASDSARVANLANQIVKNQNEYTSKDGTFDDDVLYVAKFPGSIGNSIRVSVCDSVNSFSTAIDTGSADININFSIGSNRATVVGAGSSTANAFVTAVANKIALGDRILAGNSTLGQQYLLVTDKTIVTNTSANTTTLALTFEDPYRLREDYSSNTFTRFWEFFNVVDTAPGQSPYVLSNGNTAAFDECHVVVVDDGGQFTGTPGTILEVFKGVSRATDAKNTDGSANYYKTVINTGSNYIWWANDRSEAVSNTAAYIASSSAASAYNAKMQYGADGNDEASVSLGTLGSAYDLFTSTEDVDISLVLQGRPVGGNSVATDGSGITVQNFQLANYLIDNIASVRKDCIVLISPDKAMVLNNTGSEALSLKAWRSLIRDTSYAVLDSGYKYQYDRYNDIYRWVPLNGDVAGLCVRTDNTNDAWWSPAGFNRGQIKNIVKLAFNPRKAERDVMYSNGINPVVTFPGQGTILYGDKTLQVKPSAFDRINVRRLFIVLEKAIAQAAKYSLFEFNDAFTRSQFKNLVTPYLRNIQGRRGITDFYVVCDDTNNTPQVIDTNQFIGDIYIKPARSINFIQLNFVAVGTGVQFSEVVGKF